VASSLTVAAPVGQVVATAVPPETFDRSGEGLTLTLVDTDVPSQPGTIRATVANGQATQTAYFFLDNATAAFVSQVLDTVGSASVNLPINNLTVGTHSIRVGPTTVQPVGTTANTKTFTVAQAAAPAPVGAAGTVPPLPPQAPVNHWTFQAYDFSSLANVDTYVLPVNPSKVDQSFGEQVLESEVTVVSSGLVFTWEGEGQPPLWRWEGVVLTNPDYLNALKLGVTGQRVYLTDHFRRRYLMKIASFTFQRVRDRARPWHHTYEATGWLLSDGVVV